MRWPVIVCLVCLLLFAAIFGGQIAVFRQAEAETRSGIGCYQTGAFGEAEGHLRQALRANPNNANASYYLGLCLWHEGDLTGAKQRLETARTIAQGGKLVERNEPLVEETQAALARLGSP